MCSDNNWFSLHGGLALAILAHGSENFYTKAEQRIQKIYQYHIIKKLNCPKSEWSIVEKPFYLGVGMIVSYRANKELELSRLRYMNPV